MTAACSHNVEQAARRASHLFDIAGARLPFHQVALTRRHAIQSSTSVNAVSIRALASAVSMLKVSSACAIR